MWRFFGACILVVLLGLGSSCAAPVFSGAARAGAAGASPGAHVETIVAQRPVAKDLDGTEHADWILTISEQMFIDVVGTPIFDACVGQLAEKAGVCIVWLDGGCLNASMSRKGTRLVVAGGTCRARIHELQAPAFCPEGETCRPVVLP
jgi:hypothetical protein